VPGDGLLLVVLNHPSWWDPLVGLALAGLLPAHRHYAPMDARALARYRILEWFGFFGVEPDSVMGGSNFLRTAEAIAVEPAAAIWVTAQGHFTDVRCRPIRLKSGVGHLAHRLTRGIVLPLALEYCFWDERFPEALCRFGQPLSVAEHAGLSARCWTGLIASRLEATQDALSADALARDPGRFDVLLHGRAGVGGVYETWQRAAAWIRGRPYQAEHGRPGGPR
jgi:1-acyl-sn-glycerol-3-phosphate acyltransferase